MSNRWIHNCGWEHLIYDTARLMGRVPTSRSSGPRLVSPLAIATSTQREGQPPREAPVHSPARATSPSRSDLQRRENVSSTTPVVLAYCKLQTINAIACPTHIRRLSPALPTTRPPVSENCHRHHAPPDILLDTCTTSSHLCLQQHSPVAKRCGQTRVLRA